MMRRFSRVYSGNNATGSAPGASKKVLGFKRSDITFWFIATVLAFAVGVIWDVAIAQFFSQNFNRYLLTFIFIGLSVVAAALSWLMLRRQEPSEVANRSRSRAHFIVRFGTALQLFGTILAPIGLFHATNPTRSVPVGFAFFATVFAGLFIAGFAGNALRPTD